MRIISNPTTEKGENVSTMQCCNGATIGGYRQIIDNKASCLIYKQEALLYEGD